MRRLLAIILFCVSVIVVNTHEEAQAVEEETVEKPELEEILGSVTIPMQKMTQTFKKIPMGWTTFSINDENSSAYMDEDRIGTAARWLTESQLFDAGYRLIIIDGVWWGDRDITTGELNADPSKFPAGLQRLADSLSRSNLALGLRVPMGQLDCEFPNPELQTLEHTDVETFFKLKVQYLKMRGCNNYTNPRLEVHNGDENPVGYAYSKWDEALRSQAASLEKSEVPVNDVFTSCSFTTLENDVKFQFCDTWEMFETPVNSSPLIRVASTIQYWTQNIKKMSLLNSKPSIAADYLYIGSGSMTYEQEQTQLAFWCMMSMPLIVTSDATSSSKESLSLLFNPDAINVHQDQLEQFGNLLASNYNGLVGTSVWVRRVSFGAAILVINLDISTVESELPIASLVPTELISSNDWVVKDIWQQVILASSAQVDTFVRFNLEQYESLFIIVTTSKTANMTQTVVNTTSVVQPISDSAQLSELNPDVNKNDTVVNDTSIDVANYPPNDVANGQSNDVANDPPNDVANDPPNDVANDWPDQNYLPNNVATNFSETVNTSDNSTTKQADNVTNSDSSLAYYLDGKDILAYNANKTDEQATSNYYIVEDGSKVDEHEHEHEALVYSNVTDVNYERSKQIPSSDDESNSYLVLHDNAGGDKKDIEFQNKHMVEKKTFLSPILNDPANKDEEWRQAADDIISPDTDNNNSRLDDNNDSIDISDNAEKDTLQADGLSKENVQNNKPIEPQNVPDLEELMQQIRTTDNDDVDNVALSNDQIDAHDENEYQRSSDDVPFLRHIDSLPNNDYNKVSRGVETSASHSQMYIWGMISIIAAVTVYTKLKTRGLRTGYERVDATPGTVPGRHED